MKSKKQTADELVQQLSQALTVQLNQYSSRIGNVERRCGNITDTLTEVRQKLNDLERRHGDVRLAIDLLYLKPKSKWMRFALWVDSLIGQRYEK